MNQNDEVWAIEMDYKLGELRPTLIKDAVRLPDGTMNSESRFTRYPPGTYHSTRRACAQSLLLHYEAEVEKQRRVLTSAAEELWKKRSIADEARRKLLGGG